MLKIRSVRNIDLGSKVDDYGRAEGKGYCLDLLVVLPFAEVGMRAT